MAHEAEYGPALRARLSPLMTGVGPVEAALSVTAALTRLQAAGALPDLVISVGSAGSARLDQGGVYQVSHVSYRDMDASALGFARGATPFADFPASLPLHTVPGLPRARLATGASVVSGAAYDGIAADMVDMETYALARACMAFDRPLLGLRGISDGAAPLKGITCWTDLLPVLDTRLAETLDRIAPRLAARA